MSLGRKTDEQELEEIAQWADARRLVKRVDPARCNNANFAYYHHYQCNNRGTLEEFGVKWCLTHAPSRVLRKRRERQEKERLANLVRQRRYAAQDARRKITETAIAIFDQKATFDDLEAAVIAWRNLQGDA